MDPEKTDITVRVEKTCPARWDSEIPAPGTFYQSSLWGRYLEQAPGFRPFYCRAECGSRVTGRLLAYLAPVQTGLAAKVGLEKLYWHNGPLLEHPGDLDTAEALLTALFREAGGRCVLSGSAPYVERIPEPELYPGLARRFGLKLSGWSTFLVDLRGGEDKLWETLQPEARRSVRKMQELGFEMRWLERGELDGYLDLLRRYRENAGLPLPPLYPTAALWELLGASLALPGAYLDGELKAVWPLVICGDICFFIASAHDPALEGRQRSVNDLVQWFILQQGTSRGLRYYDLAGAAPEPSDGKEEGIRRFKGKWGGKQVDYPVLEGGVGLAGRTLYVLNNLSKR